MEAAAAKTLRQVGDAAWIGRKRKCIVIERKSVTDEHRQHRK
jgi:hypothetical protein